MTDGASVPEGGRERLLDAAAAEFSELGYTGASIAGIARRAGMSKSTVFHHFNSKEALYLAVIGSAVGDFGQRIDHVLGEDGPCGQVLARFQCEHLRQLQDHRQVARLILRELQDPALEHRKPLIIELLSSNFTRLVRYLEQAQASGRIRSSVNCHVAALTLFASNAFYFQHAEDLGRMPGEGFDGGDQAFIKALVDVLIDGLLPSESSGDQT